MGIFRNDDDERPDDDVTESDPMVTAPVSGEYWSLPRVTAP